MDLSAVEGSRGLAFEEAVWYRFGVLLTAEIAVT